MNELTPEEIQAIPKMAQAAIADWKEKIKTATNPQEYDAYNERVNELMSAVETIKDLLAEKLDEVSQPLVRQIAALSALNRELKRHGYLARERSRSLRRQQPHA